jgi:hypothetical protein
MKNGNKKYDKLWNDASDMMVDLDIKYNRDTFISLDEYLSNYRRSLTHIEVIEIEKILEQISNINL